MGLFGRKPEPAVLIIWTHGLRLDFRGTWADCHVSYQQGGSALVYEVKSKSGSSAGVFAPGSWDGYWLVGADNRR